MKNTYWLVSIFICVFYTTTFFAQSPKIKHDVFTEKEGLEIDNIHAIEMDNDGFLWIGGAFLDIRPIVKSDKTNSLQRFDGKNFHNIEIPSEDAIIEIVLQIHKRTDGKFYIKTSTSLGDRFYLLNPSNLNFTLLPYTGDREFAQTYSTITSFKGKDYILYQKNTRIFLNEIKTDLTLKPIFSFGYTESRFKLDASTVLLMSENNILIGDDNFSPHFFDWQGNLLSKMPSEQFVRTHNSNIEKPYIESFFNIEDTYYVFINGHKGLQKLDNKTFSFIPVETGMNNNYAHLKSYNDKNGTPIVCTSRGNTLGLITENKGVFTNHDLLSVFKNKNSLTVFSNDVTKTLWIGTNEKELHYLKFPSEKIKTYLQDSEIRSIISLDKNNYLVASESEGWYTINKQEMTIKPYIIKENGEEIKPKSSRNIIKNGNTLWTNNAGSILEIDRQTQTAKAYRHYPVFCLEKINDSTLIYGTNDYFLMAFDTNKKNHYSLFETKDIIIYDLAIKENLIVGATNKGAFIYNFTTKENQWLDTSAIVSDSFFLMADYFDELGFVLGSREGDVIAIDPITTKQKLIYKDELKASIATLILDQKKLWINTFNGIVSYNLVNNTTQRFSTEDGFTNNETNRYSALKGDNGFLVGTIKGVNYFKPEELQPTKQNVSLKLLKLRHYVSDKKEVVDNYNVAEINNNETITIPTEFKELAIDFGITHNTAPNEFRYRYRLNKKEWTNINQKQSLSFPSLSAGKYTLEIEALSFSGKKVGNTLVLQIDSKDFFYNKWWFYAGLLLLISSILLYLLKLSKQRQTLQQKFARDLITSQEKERKRIAKDLHDSVGQRLTLIKRKTQKQNEKELTEMTNDVLEEVREISRGLYPANLKLLGLTESIKQLAYDIDEQTDLFITIELANIDTYFNEEDTLNIYRFVQESFNNIIKHANAKEVYLTTHIFTDRITINIEDNGIGFSLTEKKVKSTLGLKTLEERISVVKGQLQIISKPSVGTQIIATIPTK
ncbi:sensor histidine kinase [unidentified eubacterium SCB49]|nr:sensor histidine kinase [unidentified eubacterium SCB49]